MWRLLVLARNALAVGSAGCPCMEWAGLESYLVNDDMNIEVQPQGRAGEKFLYDPNYGNMQCKAHDLNQEPFCDGTFPPPWCFEKWCYVDPSNCDKTAVRSKYFKDTVVYYSYGACGSSNSWDKWYEEGGAEAGGSILGDLIELVEEYTKANKDAAEAASGGSCANDVASSCPCTDCSPKGTYWPGEKVAFDDITVLAGSAESDGDGTCIASTVSTTYLNVASKEYTDRTRIGYQYFGHQNSGGYGQWPKVDLSGSGTMCQDYDPRFRDWYTGAATGPKDVVLVLDKSGSMGTANRITLARDAALAVLDTFGPYDYVGVVLFSNNVMVFNDYLVPGTPENRNKLKTYIRNEMYNGGGTNFRDSLRKAFSILDASVYHVMTSTCNRAVMFLTDGEAEFFDDDYDYVTAEAKKNSVALLTYAIGSGAATEITKKLACDNRGIFYKVQDGADLKKIMSNYYLYFATGSRSCTVRWVSYDDSITGNEMLAGCLPFYSSMDSAEKGHLRGVSCVDVSLVVPLRTVKQASEYNQFQCMVEGVSRQCEALYLRDCDLAEMRAKIGPDSICPGDDTQGCGSADGYCIDPTCRDVPTFVDEAGYLCDQWVGDNCDDAFPGWASSGYTQAGENLVLEKCKYSCGKCPRLQTPEPCDAMSCGAVTGNVGCRERKVGGDPLLNPPSGGGGSAVGCLDMAASNFDDTASSHDDTLCQYPGTAGPEACTDDDACLQGKSGWDSGYTCSGSTRYCSGRYADDMLCCRESCGTCPSTDDLVCSEGVRSGVCAECTCPSGSALIADAADTQGSDSGTCCKPTAAPFNIPTPTPTSAPSPSQTGAPVELAATLELDVDMFALSVDLTDSADLAALSPAEASEVKGFAAAVAAGYRDGVAASLGVDEGDLDVTCLYRTGDAELLDLLTLSNVCLARRQLLAARAPAPAAPSPRRFRQRRLAGQSFGIAVALTGAAAAEVESRGKGAVAADIALADVVVAHGDVAVVATGGGVRFSASAGAGSAPALTPPAPPAPPVQPTPTVGEEAASWIGVFPMVVPLFVAVLS